VPAIQTTFPWNFSNAGEFMQLFRMKTAYT
jgi:hypothetical protein